MVKIFKYYVVHIVLRGLVCGVGLRCWFAVLVCDSMVLIHLAKTSLLKDTCTLFEKVVIPRGVYAEVITAGLKKGFADALVVDELVCDKTIAVVDVSKTESVQLARLEKLNVKGGEAEAVALALFKKAVLACDDGNVRSKMGVLGLRLVSTPALLVFLVKEGGVPNDKVLDAVSVLRKVGWFSSAVLDQVVLEVR